MRITGASAFFVLNKEGYFERKTTVNRFWNRNYSDGKHWFNRYFAD